jgi:murein DD-endopeptidase MepM/ murein hydrolase activator NlpD
LPSRSLRPALFGVSAALILFGASTPAVAQGMPRFAFPALAAAGGALILVSLVRSVRRWRRERRVDVGSLVINLFAVVVFVVLPFTHLARAFVPPRDGTPRIHTGYGAWVGAEGYPRWDRHRGIDVAGAPGSDVLAAADGRVTVARDNRDLCGLIVVIDHDPHGLRTVYCHFSEIAIRVGDTVARGQRIGTVGTSGQRAWPTFEHVHLELQRGRDVNALEDPQPRIVGCFKVSTAYPSDRLVLTYPVRC